MFTEDIKVSSNHWKHTRLRLTLVTFLFLTYYVHKGVFEERTATGRGRFAVLASNFIQISGQIDSIKTLRDRPLEKLWGGGIFEP